MARKKISRRRVTVQPNNVIWGKFMEIADKTGIDNYSNLFDYIVIFTHDKMFDTYKEIMRKKNTNPEIKISNKINKAKMEREMRKQEAYEICQALNGDVVENGSGGYSCKFKTYHMTTPYYVAIGEMETPFDLLTDNTVENQYKSDIDFPAGTNIKSKIQEVCQNQ